MEKTLSDEEFLLASMLTGMCTWAERGEDAPLVKCRMMGITPESFEDRDCGILYREMQAHAAKVGEAFDGASLAKHLQENGITVKGDASATTQYLEQLIDAGVLMHFDHYARRVANAARKRKVFAIMQDAANRMNSDVGSENIDMNIRRLEEQLADVLPDTTRTGDFGAAVRRQAPYLERLVREGKAAMEGLSTGFRRLDEKLFGLKRGDMIVIAARPSVGKTTLGMNIAENVARSNKGVLVFSCEMDKDALARRMLVGAAKIDQWRALRELIPLGEAETLIAQLPLKAEELSELPLYVEDQGISEVWDMRLHARRVARKHELALIVVDYMQLLKNAEMSRQGRQYETAAISRELKAMARELKVPVIAISQLSRESERNGADAEPRLSDLRDSGAIEQDADVVMLIRRPLMQKGKGCPADLLDRVYVNVAKHRNGEIGEVPMRFVGKYNRFEDLTEEEWRAAKEYTGAPAQRPYKTDEDLKGL